MKWEMRRKDRPGAAGSSLAQLSRLSQRAGNAREKARRQALVVLQHEAL